MVKVMSAESAKIFLMHNIILTYLFQFKVRKPKKDVKTVPNNINVKKLAVTCGEKSFSNDIQT
jgi:hypothetical protein